MKMAAATIAAAMAIPAAADAAVVVTINQVGTGVVATTSGTLSLTGLTANTGYSLSLGAYPLSGYIATGSTDGAAVTGYSGMTGPTTFGPGSAYITATSGTGASFAVNGSGFGSPFVFVSSTYVSGASVAGTSTFANATLASLGYTTGSFVFRSNADTVTVNIGTAPIVPEPATWAMMMAGVGMVGFAMRRRQTVRTVVKFA